MSEIVYLLAARRSAVATRGGAFKNLSLAALSTPVIQACLADARLNTEAVEQLIIGNALGAGGNPARLIGLAADIKQQRPMLSIDSQCCSGMDAILLGHRLIQSGEAEVVLAGGAESYSQAPLRAYPPAHAGAAIEHYQQPPFTPWPERDPAMITAASELAISAGITRQQQWQFAMHSHAKACAAAKHLPGIVRIGGLAQDSVTRPLTLAACQRIARRTSFGAQPDYALDCSVIALEADAAAFVLLCSERFYRQHGGKSNIVIADSLRGGDIPWQPVAALTPVLQSYLHQHQRKITDYQYIELMEAFAVQALHSVNHLGITKEQLNVQGGALARGHPIAASGAILCVNLFQLLLQQGKLGARGLMGIASAGGLASVAELRKTT